MLQKYANQLSNAVLGGSPTPRRRKTKRKVKMVPLRTAKAMATRKARKAYKAGRRAKRVYR